jgi:hypothetical protein
MDSNAIFVYGFNKAYSSINVLLVFGLYLIIIIFYLIFIKTNRISFVLFLSLLLYHTFISLFQYYKGGISDSIAYYNSAASASRFTYDIFSSYDLGFMQALLFPLIHYFKLTFLSCNILFNLFGFGGLIVLYLAILDYLKLEDGKGTYIPYLLFFPSFSFWTGFAGKDAILFFSLGLFIYSIVNINKRMLFAIFALGLMLQVRPYMCIIVSLSVLMAVFSAKDSSFIAKVILIFAMTGFLLLGRNFFIEKQNIDIANIYESQKGIESTQGAWGGGSDTAISNYNIPGKLFTFLYRPLFFDAHSLMMVVSSFENLFLLIISICFLKPNIYKVILSEKSFFTKFNLYYFFIATTILSYANSNLGTIARKRIMVTISLIVLVSIYYHRRKTFSLNVQPQIRQYVTMSDFQNKCEALSKKRSILP